MINRGSEWRKWDLHIHTPASINQSYGNNEQGWNKFINALENLPSDVKVIGITDYYFIDGYEIVMRYKKSGRLNNIDKIFPILEFRIDTFGTATESKFQKINLHILFNIDEEKLEYEINKVKTEFIGQIPITKLSKHSTKMLSIKNLTEEGGSLAKGFADLIPSTSIVFKKIKSETWKDKTFLFLGYKEWSNIEKNQQLKPFKADLYQKVDAFLSSGIEKNQKNQEWLNEYGNKRLLHSLDIHDFDLLDTYEFDENGNKKALKNYCCNTWIKAQPTFEGLKQIIYEPQERVKIQKEMPESEKLDNLMINKVYFTSSNNRFTSEPIYFSKNLNVIIGGKSSGKSILLYKIARTLYGALSLDEEDSKYDVLKFLDSNENKYKDLYDLSSISKTEKDEKFDFHVELFSGSSQSLKERQKHSSILPSIKYIPQNHLSNLVDRSRRSGKTLKKLIRNLILEDSLYKKKYEDFVAQAKRNDTQRNQDIDYYFTLRGNWSAKEKDLKEKGDTKALEEGILSNKGKIESLNKTLTIDELAQYNSLTERLRELKISENRIDSDYKKLSDLYANLKRHLSEAINQKRIILNSIETSAIKDKFENKLKFVEEAYKSIDEIENELLKDANGFFKQDTIFDSEVSQIKFESKEIKQQLLPYNSKLENQKQIEVLQKSIIDDEAKLVEINQLQKEIEDIKINIEQQKVKILSDFKENYGLYEKILNDLQPRIKSIEGETEKIEIIGSKKYNFPKFRNLMEEIFDGRSFKNNDFDYLYQYSNNSPKTALEDINYEDIESALKCIFSRIEDKTLMTKKSITESEACKKIFTDFFFDHWDVKSQGDDIHNMSTGKASFVLLKLIIKLSNANAPILIDQPEDNLDNRSISKELVEYLKEKKKDRQIILVTHNPNIVVNADAENVIVANQKGQNDVESTSKFLFDYTNGALEDSFPKNDGTDLLKCMGIREHITEVVEGGLDAFKKREEKYGFK